MKKYWEQLQPLERRWVAFILIALFVVLNWWKVWPHFSDWGKADARMLKANDLMAKYRGEIKNRSSYEAKIRELQADTSSEIKDEDQAIDLVRFYTSRANSNQVTVINNSRITTRTNDPFFVDNEMQLSVVGRENHIVNFLYSLSAGSSIVRVRAMSLRPDSTHQQVNANISIVASYAKKLPVRNTGAAAPKTAAASTPAAKTAVQTNQPLAITTHHGAATNSTNKSAPINAKRP
jgi:hypothetical protein